MANHEQCDQLGEQILAQFFQPPQVIGYSLGKADNFLGQWVNLNNLVDQWWDAYKVWEAQDTLADAYKEQRLTVKGTTTMDTNIEARERVGEPAERYGNKAWPKTQTFSGYKIVKTNASIAARLDPKVFVPDDGGESQKTALGYHDLSALLLNPKNKISKQQYKGRKEIPPDQVYVFMPLSYAKDQAVFHNINTLAKAYRDQGQSDFYNKVRRIRSQMTRIKLAAEHDMATGFVMVGKTSSGRPKFKYTLMDKTDVSQRDVTANVVNAKALNAGLQEYVLEDVLKKAITDTKVRDDVQSTLKEVLRPLFTMALLPPQEFRATFERRFTDRQYKSKLERITNLTHLKGLIVEAADPKFKQTKTTVGILEARQRAAINYQTLVLGEMMRYAEVTIAYRKHAGDFPKFATYDKENQRWIVGTIDGANAWAPVQPEETFSDTPG